MTDNTETKTDTTTTIEWTIKPCTNNGWYIADGKVGRAYFNCCGCTAKCEGEES